MANTSIRSDSLYVSNLSYSSTGTSLQQAFPDCVSADVIMDRSGTEEKSKGYGFVRFPSAAEAQRVLDNVGGPGGTRNIDGRDVKINYAHNKERSGGNMQGRGGGFNNRGGRGGSRGGYNNQGGSDSFNQWSGQGGYNQPGFGGQQSYGQGGQGGYGAAQQYAGQGQPQGNYYGQQGNYTQQTPDSSAYGGQNWQQQQQGQNWQQQPSWNQGQGYNGSGDYQQPTSSSGNWSGSYQQ